MPKTRDRTGDEWYFLVVVAVVPAMVGFALIAWALMLEYSR
jgi:hypothetical protein